MYKMKSDKEHPNGLWAVMLIGLMVGVGLMMDGLIGWALLIGAFLVFVFEALRHRYIIRHSQIGRSKK